MSLARQILHFWQYRRKHGHPSYYEIFALHRQVPGPPSALLLKELSTPWVYLRTLPKWLWMALWFKTAGRRLTYQFPYRSWRCFRFFSAVTYQQWCMYEHFREIRLVKVGRV